MKIRNSSNFFDRINKIIAVLKEKRESDFANELEEAKAVSTVPGEIFGEIRLVLSKIHAKAVDKKIGFEEEVLKLISELNKALN